MADHSARNVYPVDPIMRQLMIIRESRRIRQASMATLMGTTQKTLSEMELGQVDTKLSRVRAYVRALDLSLYVGGLQMYPDLEKMTVRDLIDLYYLIGEELEKRVASAMNPPIAARENLNAA